MTEVERIADQLDRAMSGEAWHGPPLSEILGGVNAQQAVARPIAGGHSIWELALHIGAWLDAGRRRLQGDRAQLADAEDWPVVSETTEEAWQQAKDSITRNGGALRSVILSLSDSQLEEPVLEGMSSVYVTLHGIVQHTLYHAGQIAILKKAIGEDSDE